MSVWKEFCRAIEDKQTRRLLGDLVSEIDQHSVFEFTREQSDKAKECEPADLSQEDGHPIPPFPFPKLCVVHHNGVLALREPVMDEDTGILEFDILTWLGDKTPGPWFLCAGSVSVDTGKRGEDGRFVWEVFNAKGIMSDRHDEVTYFDEDTPLVSRNIAEESIDEFDRRNEVLYNQIKKNIEKYEAKDDSKKVAQLREELASLEKTYQEFRDLKEREQVLTGELAEKAKEIGKVSLDGITDSFYIAIQNIAWINLPNNFIVETSPSGKLKKPKKDRIARQNERKRHVVLTKNQISDAWRRVHQGGTHASPLPHLRRGHYKTLRAERYKEKRGKRIWVRASHVGGECVEWGEGDVRYKVL